MLLGYICAVVGLVICPWQFLTSASNFATYLSAYSVFLSSIAGTMISDYYLVRRGYLEPFQLNTADANGLYYGIGGLPVARLRCLHLRHSRQCRRVRGSRWVEGTLRSDIHISVQFFRGVPCQCHRLLSPVQCVPAAGTESNRGLV